jgi:hypothetical protein
LAHFLLPIVIQGNRTGVAIPRLRLTKSVIDDSPLFDEESESRSCVQLEGRIRDLAMFNLAQFGSDRPDVLGPERRFCSGQLSLVPGHMCSCVAATGFS